MPIEDRRIIFDILETYQALYTLTQKQDEAPRLLSGIIDKIEEQGDDHNKINIYIVNPQNGKSGVVAYSRDFVAAALMMFCRGAGIPLPKKAKKSVLIRDGKLVLRVTV